MGDAVNVLLVDDKRENLDALEAMLEPLGAELVRAQSADEALLALVKHEFAAIVLDIRMPGMDGLELAQIVKRRKRTQHVPILFLTAHMLDERDALRGYDVGAVDYLNKPVNPGILRSKIAVFIDLYSKTRALAEANGALLVESAERQRMAAELRAANNALEARVEQRTAEAIAALRSARASEERLQQALAGARAGVWEYDLVRGSTYWSPEMFDLYGLDRSGPAPAFDQLASFLHPDDRQRVADALRAAVARGARFAQEFRLVRADRRVTWIRSQGVVEHGLDGRPIAARGVDQDVTAHREAEEALRRSEKRMRVANAAAGLGTYVADVQAGVIRYGPYMCNLLGLPAGGETSFEDGFRFVHPDDLPRLRDALRASLDPSAEGRLNLELRVLRPNAPARWYSFSGQFEFRNTPTGRIPVEHIGAIFDITERRNAETILREADRRKDEFLATLSHELRNPLAPLRNGLQILSLAGDDPEVAGKVRDMMERQVNHLVRLVDDLLEVSRITRGKILLRKEPLDLVALVRSAIETARPAIEAAHHELVLELPSTALAIDADPVRMVQVFANLLNNAAKFTDEGGRIRISVARQDAMAIVRVRDTGVGIAAELLPRVFDVFVQADQTRARPQGGLGIGLSLARTLIELHGGSIEARSPGPGLGSEFEVRLPLAIEASERLPAVRPPDSPSRPLEGRRVLLVDDNHDTVDSLAVMLRLLGSDVRVAYDGHTALAMLAEQRPDAVMLDIGMPGMDGYELARRIRVQRDLRDLLLVAMTGWGQLEDRRRSMEAGFDHHLVKPVDIDSLQQLLRTATTGAE